MQRVALGFSGTPMVALALCCAAPVPAQDSPVPAEGILARVRAAVRPLFEDAPQFSISLRAFGEHGPDPTAPRVSGDEPASRGEVAVELVRRGAQSFALSVESRWASLRVVRDEQRTVLVVPGKNVAFLGEGGIPEGAESLAPAGFVSRLLGRRSGILGVGRALLEAWAKRLEDRAGEAGERVDLDDRTTLFAPRGRPRTLAVASRAEQGLFEGLRSVELSWSPRAELRWPSLAGLTVRSVERAELEHMAFRALRRSLEIRLPRWFGVPRPRPAKVAHGELRRVGEQNLVLLAGTPEQIGRAHARLLGRQVRATLDSTFYLVGMVESVRTGKWFPGELEEAWRRLSPYVPERHRREMTALARALPDVSEREMELASVFPEYFHCSGFALFGKATRDGVLYHGRVLDYMTLIGLQRAAVTFVVKPRGFHAFLSAGYAGFTGVVSGMNDARISLGEMGGRGRYRWDGVPMATLMRRALEECSTLEEVCALWRAGPRTCEYYYVFADGKIPDAVGVAATPDRLEFIRPGEGHELLGPGIEDAVILSAGDRLRLLRQRVRENYGRIDERAAMRLMDRPVAMRSNLHNVLFVPQHGVAWVANAGDHEPAAERPYVRYDLEVLLEEMQADIEHDATRGGEDEEGEEIQEFEARDSLGSLADPSPDAAAMLAELGFEPGSFTVRVRQDRPGPQDALVLFPSPRPRGDARNDTVVAEWYRARGRDGAFVGGPAVIVNHILDGRMRVARTIARVLASHGVHAFVVHMPDYGLRGDRRAREDPTRLLARCRQGVADVRRARDAVAVLPGVDGERVAIQGTSLGGFATALAASLDGAFSQVFVALAGGDLFEMVMHGGKDAGKVRAEMLRAGWTSETIRAALWSIEPTRIAHRLDPQRTWLYTGLLDVVVPARCADALARAAGLDETHHIRFWAGHYSAAIFMPWVVRDIVEKMLESPRVGTAARTR